MPSNFNSQASRDSKNTLGITHPRRMPQGTFTGDVEPVITDEGIEVALTALSAENSDNGN